MLFFFCHAEKKTIGMYIAYVQARPKYLHLEELGTKWGKEEWVPDEGVTVEMYFENIFNCWRGIYC